MKNIFDLVKELLEKYPKLRDSDKHLIWNVWGMEGHIKNGCITKEAFLKGSTTESITRARRKVQEMYPHLQATKQVLERRRQKEMTLGGFIYHE